MLTRLSTKYLNNLTDTHHVAGGDVFVEESFDVIVDLPGAEVLLVVLLLASRGRLVGRRVGSTAAERMLLRQPLIGATWGPHRVCNETMVQ